MEALRNGLVATLPIVLLSIDVAAGPIFLAPNAGTLARGYSAVRSGACFVRANPRLLRREASRLTPR